MTIFAKRQLINRNTIGEDLTAGLVLGIQSVPDGLANGLLAMVNPVYGLYGYMTGIFSGAFFTSSVFMSIQATGAMALIIASVPQVTEAPEPNTALFALAILTGLIMLGAGLLKLGSLVRFVPHSVMIGFVNAVAVLIVLGQLDDFTGYDNISAGVTIALAILLFGRLVGLIAMPVLAGLLIVVGFRALKLDQAGMVAKTGAVQLVVMLLTFISALFIPLQYAVLIGVGFAVLLYVFHQSNRISVRAWELGPGLYPVECAPPASVPAKKVTILAPYGSLFFAAAPVFRKQLPEVTETSRHAAVILVLRGKKAVGSTFLKVITHYADELARQESMLMLSGVDPNIQEQLERTGMVRHIGRSNVFLMTEVVGQALHEAIEAAETWIAAQPPDAPSS